MIDLFDIFQMGQIGRQAGQIGAISALQAHTDQRVTKQGQAASDLERHYEYLRLLTMAMWKIVKERTGATDDELRECVEQIDLLDGKKDGKVTRHRGVTDCESCKRRILKSAIVCVYCGTRNHQDESFHRS